MSRRIVLIDLETHGFASFFGCGLGKEIYSIQQLEAMDSGTRNSIISGLKMGDAVMSVGGAPFKFLKEYYHMGIRNEVYTDCAILRRLSMEGGAFLKVVTDTPSKEVISDFMSPGFTEPNNKLPKFSQYLISDYKKAIEYIDFLDSAPLSQHYGFDYETSGMPLDKEFWVSGLSLVTENIGAFISFTDIRHELGGEDNTKFLDLKRRIAEFLEKRQDHIWTYNVQYEWQVSHRIFGVDLYNLCDASVVNVMDGYHLKKFSLKWTAQRVLEVMVWDSEFDRISDMIDQMYFIVEGKLKKDKKKVLKVNQSNFESSPEWEELVARYPNDIDEMRSLVLEYWGMPFMVPSSRILGHYCCLDSFYTLMIAESRFNTYNSDCWRVNLDNARLGARLMGSGLYIDEPYRERYESYSKDQQVWSITYCAMARCWIKMEKHKEKMADIKKFSPGAIKLIKDGRFHNGVPGEIAKDLMTAYLDTLDCYPTGLNEGQLLLDFGADFSNEFIKAVKEVMSEVKMKTKIEPGIERKRKFMACLSTKLVGLLGLDKIKNQNRLVELEKYMYYKKAYDEMKKVCERQLIDIEQVPEEIFIFGEKMTREQYSKFISDNYFKCKSPEENDKIALELTNLFRPQTAYLGALLKSTQQLPDTDKFYSGRGITDIKDGYSEFMGHWKEYTLENKKSSIYPDKIFDQALTYYRNQDDDMNKETWTNFNGFLSQSTFFPEVSKEYLEYEKHFDPSDMTNDFFFMRKMILNYLVYKKYAKLESTYVGSTGMFHKTGKWVIEGPDHIPVREASGPKEKGAVWKVFVRYEVMMKSSKRWSSPFHTIISHGDCKDCMCPPPAWDKDGNMIYGGSNQLLTYFDISSAEVKAAGYASKDPDLIDKFNKGEDIYIYSAKLYLGESEWNRLDGKQKKKWRKRFKTIFLGVLYGLGKNSLAERLECSIEEAEHIIQGLYRSFPQLRVYVEEQGNFPIQNDGYINTFLGDRLRLVEWTDYLPKAKSDREANNILARIKRLGVNLPIQGGTSSLMACGFYNNIRCSIIDAKNNPESPFKEHALQPIIVVHDSNTNYMPSNYVFDIFNYYTEHYTKYCKEISINGGQGITLLYDLLCGYSYERACTLKQIDKDTVEFSGSSYQLVKLYDKIMACQELEPTCSMTREDIVSASSPVKSPYLRFVIEGGCSMVKDTSKLTIQFHRNK